MGGDSGTRGDPGMGRGPRDVVRFKEGGGIQGWRSRPRDGVGLRNGEAAQKQGEDPESGWGSSNGGCSWGSHIPWGPPACQV